MCNPEKGRDKIEYKWKSETGRVIISVKESGAAWYQLWSSSSKRVTNKLIFLREYKDSTMCMACAIKAYISWPPTNCSAIFFHLRLQTTKTSISLQTPQLTQNPSLIHQIQAQIIKILKENQVLCYPKLRFLASCPSKFDSIISLLLSFSLAL